MNNTGTNNTNRMDATVVVDVFTHDGRCCVVVRRDLAFVKTFHNGYVSVLLANSGTSYDEYVGQITTDELTFAGELDWLNDERIPPKTWFVGFDSCHYRNDENPASKTFGPVRERTIRLANEMAEKHI